MIKADNSKRAFFKKAAAAVGFVAAANYASNLLSAHADSLQEVNSNSAHDANMQKKMLLRKQFTLMTDDDKEQMLGEILNNHNKHQA